MRLLPHTPAEADKSEKAEAPDKRVRSRVEAQVEASGQGAGRARVAGHGAQARISFDFG